MGRPASSMIDDAVTSIRSLFHASLLVMIIWLLGWPISSEKLRVYAAAVELSVWLDFKERLSTLERDIFEAESGDVISEDITWVRRIAPNEELYPAPTPLTVDVTWPEPRVYHISLIPAGFDPKLLTSLARAYRIETGEKDDNPWDSYYALFLRESQPVLEGDEVVDADVTVVGLVGIDDRAFRAPQPGLRQVEAAVRDGNRPARWDDVRLYLATHGYTGPAQKLTSRDVALAALRAEVDPRVPSGGVQLFGVQLSVAQFFFAVGVLLAGVAFVMLGPLLTVRATGDRTHAQCWVLAVPRSAGFPRRLLDWTIMAVTILWALAPLLILLLQVKSYSGAGGAVGWLFWLGAVGLVLASLTYGWVAWELRVIRFAGGADSASSREG